MLKSIKGRLAVFGTAMRGVSGWSLVVMTMLRFLLFWTMGAVIGGLVVPLIPVLSFGVAMALGLLVLCAVLFVYLLFTGPWERKLAIWLDSRVFRVAS